MRIETSIIVPLINAIVEMIKSIPCFKENTKWYPFISMVTGVILGVLAGIFYSGEKDVAMMILQGLIYGLTASGLYSAVNSVNKLIKGE